jgi:hypothetical protein
MTCKEFAQAAWGSAGALAAADAHRFGQANGVEAAFVVPVLPQLPAVEGTFQLFQPVLQGREHVESMTATYSPTGGNGGAIPDFAYPHRLGPYARLFPGRDDALTFVETGRKFVGGTAGAGVTRGSHGINIQETRRVGNSARQRDDYGRPDQWVAEGYHEVVGYTTFGPYDWAKRFLRGWARGYAGTPTDMGSLRYSYYYEYLDKIAGMKLDYMFPASGVGETTVTQTIHYPVWVVPYPLCKKIGEDENNKVTSTMCYVVEIASKYPETSPEFLRTEGTYRTNGRYRREGANRQEKGLLPIAVWMNGWSDPAKWGLPQVSDYVWKDSYVYETTQDSELGIQKQTIPPGDPQGEVVWQPVYMYAWYIFGGIDIGGTQEVSNPANWDRFDRLPAPILLDTSQGDYGGDDPDVGWRRDKFMYLGVARKRTEAPVWPQRFSHVNPLHGMMAIAQAKVFNNKSFDLWTQDWQVQLAPVTRLVPTSDAQSWAARLEAGVDEAGESDIVPAEEVETASKYLSSMDADMARLYMNH